MKTNRRSFLGSIGLGSVGILGGKLLKPDSVIISDYANSMNTKTPNTVIPGLVRGNPRDVKLNVKGIFYAMIHSGIWEGPCRYTGGGTGPEAERIQAKNQFDKYVKDLKSSTNQDVNFLEPAYFEFPEYVNIGREDLLQLDADKDEVDLYVLTGMQLTTHLEVYFVSLLVDIYKKPVVGRAEDGRATSSYLKCQGLEGYAAIKYGGLDKLYSLLRARKAFQHTNMLLVTDFKGPQFLGSSARDFDSLKDRYGIGTTLIPFKELSDERDRILRCKNDMAEVENLTDNLIKNAQGVHIDRKMLNGDVLFYSSVKKLMMKYNCNAFSTECFEFCATKLPDNWKIVPCLIHSLLKDEGYPSACEGDIGALLSEALFMAITKKSCYMGNLYLRSKDSGRLIESTRWVKGADSEGAKLWVGHNVPGLKMLGFNKPDLPYEIRNFINEKPDFPGWGASLKIDFTEIEEKTVTIGLFNRLTNKMLVTKGDVIGMQGFDTTTCSLGAFINIKDPEGMMARSADYGSHFAMIYGDVTQELIHLREMLNIEFEFFNV